MDSNAGFISNKNSRALFFVLSGVTGGKDEPLVNYLSRTVSARGSVLTLQFANDPLYQNSALPEMEEMTFANCFSRIDRAMQIAGGTELYSEIIFLAHSFSAVIVSYYLGLHTQTHASSPHYTLVIIDSDPSSKLLAYLDAQSEEFLRDKTRNPFHASVVDFMRTHDSAEILRALPVSVISIEASEIGADHEFTSDDSKRQLAEKILRKLPANL